MFCLGSLILWCHEFPSQCEAQFQALHAWLVFEFTSCGFVLSCDCLWPCALCYDPKSRLYRCPFLTYSLLSLWLVRLFIWSSVLIVLHVSGFLFPVFPVNFVSWFWPTPMFTLSWFVWNMTMLTERHSPIFTHTKKYLLSKLMTQIHWYIKWVKIHL